MAKEKPTPAKRKKAKVPAKRRAALPPMRKTVRTWDRDKVLTYICSEISSSSDGIQQIINRTAFELPRRQKITDWLDAEGNEDHRVRYARAREAQADLLVDEMISIADDATNDYMDKVNSEGETKRVLDSEHIQRSRLRIDTRKFIASKLRPKVYGDAAKKEEVEVNINITLEELAQQIKAERCIN